MDLFLGRQPQREAGVQSGPLPAARGSGDSVGPRLGVSYSSAQPDARLTGAVLGRRVSEGTGGPTAEGVCKWSPSCGGPSQAISEQLT